MTLTAMLVALIIWPNPDDPAVAFLRTFDGPGSTEECWDYLYHSPYSGYCVEALRVQRPMARPDDLMEGRE